MDPSLQRHCARYIYIVPEGLRELMSDISREVLRAKPEDIYMFVADYLDALMITRENARVAARLIQSITEIGMTTIDFLEQTGVSREEADRIVNIIQSALKKYVDIQPEESEDISDEILESNLVNEVMEEADIQPEIANQAAQIIQNAYKNFRLRRQKEKELLKGMIDWRVAARCAIHLYRKTGVSYPEAQRAATLIKAAYKGYYTRRVMKKLTEQHKYDRIVDYLEQEESQEFESYLPEETAIKEVSINFDSVIPHVIFSEPPMSTEGATTNTESGNMEDIEEPFMEKQYVAKLGEEERVHDEERSGEEEAPSGSEQQSTFDDTEKEGGTSEYEYTTDEEEGGSED